MPRLVRWQYSDPQIRTPLVIERREYFDEPSPVVDGRAQPAQLRRLTSRAPSTEVLVVSKRERRPSITLRDSETTEDHRRRSLGMQRRRDDEWHEDRLRIIQRDRYGNESRNRGRSQSRLSKG